MSHICVTNSKSSDEFVVDLIQVRRGFPPEVMFIFGLKFDCHRHVMFVPLFKATPLIEPDCSKKIVLRNENSPGHRSLAGMKRREQLHQRPHAIGELRAVSK